MKKLIVAAALCAAVVMGGLVARAADFYVAPEASGGSESNPGTKAEPFAKIATAITAAKAAIEGGEPSATVHLATGTYTERGLQLSAAIKVVGEGATRDDVIVNGGDTAPCVFQLTGNGAELANLTVKNGRAANPSLGGNVYVTAGTMVTNCVVRDGSVNLAGYGDKGANIYMTGGTIADCVVSGGKNATQGRSAPGYQLYATGGHVLRTEFKNGVRQGGTENRGSICAVMLDGAVVLENCFLHNLESFYWSATLAYGLGTIYVNSASAKVVNCTICNNRAVRAKEDCAGIYLAQAGSVINCIVYKNNGSYADSAALEWGNKNGTKFVNCAFGEGLAAYPSDESNVTNLTDSAFVDFLNGDIAPKAGSALVDAGDTAASAAAGATSATDFLGQPRVSPETKPIDIGAIERQSAGLTVVGESADEKLRVGETMEFTGTAVDAEGPVTFTWDFGDGTPVVSTDSTTVPHVYEKVGFYTVTVSGDDGTTATAPYALTKRIRVAPYNLYVATTGTDDDVEGRGLTEESPYATIGYALSRLTTDTSPGLAAVDGVTIHLATGTYTERGLQLSAAIKVVGEGATRDDVAVNGNSTDGRVFALSHAEAALVNLTVKNGRNSGEVSGANVHLSAGTVTNCVVRDGQCNGAYIQKGANIYMTGGVVADCLVIDGRNVTPGRAAVGYQLYATGGHVLRTEFKDGSYVGGDEHDRGSVCAVWLDGDVVFENCYLHDLESFYTDMGDSYGIGLGAIYVNNKLAKVVNCTVVGNKPISRSHSKALCGGIYLAAAATVVNCVIYKNNGSYADSAMLEWGNMNGAKFGNCAFGEGLAAYPSNESNVTNLADSAFVDVAKGDYRPSSASSLVNAGDTDFYNQEEGLSSLDLDRQARIRRHRIDIGAYEVYRKGFIITIR